MAFIYTSTWRSNTFRVLDLVEFETWIYDWPQVEFVDSYGNNHVQLFRATDEEVGLLPTYAMEANGQVDDSRNFMLELSQHIDPTSVAVLIQAGMDNHMLVEGHAYAIRNHDGADQDKIVMLDLLEIETLAKRKFGLRPNSFNNEPDKRNVA